MKRTSSVVAMLLIFCVFSTSSLRADVIDDLSFYKLQSETTSPGSHADLYRDLPRDPAALVKVVQGLVLHGGLGWLYKYQPPKERLAEFASARTAEQILDNVVRLDPSALTIARPIERRAVGNCRTFSVLMVSMLRFQGIPARMRVGYSTYTWGPPNLENHFVVQYFNGQRWVLLDAQIDDVQRRFHKLDFDTLDIPPGKFIFAGQAWQGLRDGTIRPEQIGIGGPNGWQAGGFQFVQIDLLADCWALDKTELFTGECNDFARQAHDTLTAYQLREFDTLAQISATPTADVASLKSVLESDPRLRVDPKAWKPVIDNEK